MRVALLFKLSLRKKKMFVRGSSEYSLMGLFGQNVHVFLNSFYKMTGKLLLNNLTVVYFLSFPAKSE